MRRRPPALGRWLLRRGLPRGIVAESIAGDLEHEFHARRRRARSWYLRQVLVVLAASLRDRLRGRRWTGGAAVSTESAGAGGASGGAASRQLFGGGVGRGGGRGAPESGPLHRPGGRRGRWVADFGHDLRFAVRLLAQRPLFAAVAVATLAIGIGINTSIFTVVNALLLRPVPAVSAPAGLIEIYRGEGSDFIDVAYPAIAALRAGATTIADVAGWTGTTVAFRDGGALSESGGPATASSGAGPATEREAVGRRERPARRGGALAIGNQEAVVLRGFQVTGNYFSVLGAQPALGRFFAPQDSFYPRVAGEVVISHALWQRRYDGSPAVLGREVSINGYPVRIIGVAPEGFAGHQILVQRDVFVPVGLPAPGLLSSNDLDDADSGSLVLLGRLAEGTGLAAARQQLGALGDRYAAAHGIGEPYRLHAEPYGGVPGTDRAMVALFFTMLMVIVAMVLAIACVNVANMLLSRGLERRRELAIRMSLGAGRGRVVRQLLTESALLFLLAGIAGLLLTAWLTGALVNLYLPQMASTHLYLDVSPDPRVFAFAFAIAAFTGLVFGLTPALGATRSGAPGAARSAGRHLRRPRLRAVLVGGQMAAALVLLVAAGLMVRALSALQAVDLGYDVDGVYSVELSLQLAGYDATRSRIFYAALLDRVRAIPGVRAAATARKQPMATRSVLGGIYPEGLEPPDEQGYSVDFNRVSPDYFHTTGIALLAGREFAIADDETAPRVAIINASMAKRLWGGGAGVREDATALHGPEPDLADAVAPLAGVVGKRFTVGRGTDAVSYEVIGVAADAHYNGTMEETPSFVYLAAAQSPNERAYLLVRADDLAGTIGAVRSAVARLDPNVPVIEVETMRAVVDGFSMGQRLAAWVAGVVGAVGLVLGAVGVYGVTAFAVAQRRHEIGVRMALGAGAADVLRLMLRSGLRAPLAGMAVGTLAAAAAARLIGSFLYGISPLDPWTYASVIAGLGLVALVAILLPARRATAVDPMATLRAE